VADAAGVDPVAFRLSYLEDERAREVLETAARQMGPRVDEFGRGVGVAFAQYKNMQCYAAVAVELRVDDATAAVRLDRVVVNGLYERRFGARDAGALERAADTAGTPAARAAVRAALSEHVRARGQREEVARLGHRDGTLAGLAVTGGVITSAGVVLAATFSALWPTTTLPPSEARRLVMSLSFRSDPLTR